MSASYPYLAVARAHDVPYGDVLSLADKLDGLTTTRLLSLYGRLDDNLEEPWMQATYDAWKGEMRRRSEEGHDHV